MCRIDDNNKQTIVATGMTESEQASERANYVVI